MIKGTIDSSTHSETTVVTRGPVLGINFQAEHLGCDLENVYLIQLTYVSTLRNVSMKIFWHQLFGASYGFYWAGWSLSGKILQLFVFYPT